jgi:hypothetical protein
MVLGTTSRNPPGCLPEPRYQHQLQNPPPNMHNTVSGAPSTSAMSVARDPPSNSPITRHLTMQGGLTQMERDQRIVQGLCLYCRGQGQKASECSKARKAREMTGRAAQFTTPASVPVDSSTACQTKIHCNFGKLAGSSSIYSLHDANCPTLYTATLAAVLNKDSFILPLRAGSEAARILFNSRASDCFVSPEFLARTQITPCSLPTPITLCLFDGTL